MSSDILNLLTSSSKLDRDNGLSIYQDFLTECTKNNTSVIDEVIQELEKRVKNVEVKWEEKHGYLLALKSLVAYKKTQNDDQFLQYCQTVGIQHLQDIEVRVRDAAGELMGELCLRHGVNIYRNNCDKVISLIRDNLERKMDSENEGTVQESVEVGRLMEKLAANNTADSAQIFHDTAGWKNLETSMKCLQHMVEGCGTEFRCEFNAELLELITTTLNHTNRFVRETGYYVCTTLISACSEVASGDDSMEVDEVGVEANEERPGIEQNPILKFGHSLSSHLALGLSDNWSQVRLASSTATRAFLLSLDREERRQFYPVILPRLCLNRYYLAEGVRIYSQKTWGEVVGAEGCSLVLAFLKETVEYYVESTQANNHAVREAACQCIAELAKKIDLKALKPYVDILLRTLIDCFKDDSWPVRDMACVAAGSFVRCYPEESRSSLHVLMELFWQNLGDPISSVRQGAAIALANTVRAYGEEVLLSLQEKVVTGLENLKNQPVESEKYGNLETGPANFSVAKKIRDNDADLHENQQMYSCGSLAPKMGRGGGGGGCTDSKFRKASEPWELADGCVHLVGELANIKECEPVVDKLLTQVSKAQEHKHFMNHLSLFQTICVRFSGIARVVNKRVLKPHLEQYFDLIFYCLESENGLSSYSAEDCLANLSAVLGPNILSGRIENFNPRYLEAYNRHLRGDSSPASGQHSSPGGGPFFGSPGAGTPSTPMSIPSRADNSYHPSLGGTPT